jgi:hypothetical protein
MRFGNKSILHCETDIALRIIQMRGTFNNQIIDFGFTNSPRLKKWHYVDSENKVFANFFSVIHLVSKNKLKVTMLIFLENIN